MATPPRRRRIIANGYEHDYNPLCDVEGINNPCEDVEVKPKFEPPEFTIDISYEDYANPLGVFQTGWKYNLSWKNAFGDTKVAYKYGYPTQTDAREAAEERAKRVVLAAMPTETYKYKYTP